MPIRLGSALVDDIRLGSSSVAKLMLGDSESWSPPAASWPQGVAAERAYYGGNGYTFDAGTSTTEQYWYICDVPETVPYYVNDQTWHNGMGDALPSNPTQNP